MYPEHYELQYDNNHDLIYTKYGIFPCRDNLVSTYTPKKNNDDTYHLPCTLQPLVALVLRRSIVHDERARAVVTHREHARHVPAAVAVVRRAPHGHELLVEHVLEAFLHELVRARD